MAPIPNAPYRKLAIVGAGAWGTALALVAARAGRDVILWAREADVVASIRSDQENKRFLAGVKLPASLSVTGNMVDCRVAEVILVTVPAQHQRAVLSDLSQAVGRALPIVICAKGLEEKTGLLLHEVLLEVWPGAEPLILSGPSFARDVARKFPTAVTVAGHPETAERFQASLGSALFRPYVTDDVTGVALGGAAKNVYAIGCGMVEGAGLGESARAALLARSFAELMRLGTRVGARAETLMGLSGLGDLVLTATSPTSRNFALGISLGKGASLKDVIGEGKPLAEGAATAPALVKRGHAEGVELPIAEAVADVLAGQLDVQGAAERLLTRPVGRE